jgi:hypothetical protein
MQQNQSVDLQTQSFITKYNRESTSLIKFSPISLYTDYRKKWNVHNGDFICLTIDGILVNNSLYRVGMFEADLKEDYFMLLKYTEAMYEDSITKDKKRKPHLESRWCILNKKGEEKVVFKPYESPSLSGGVIYSIGQKYFNIETGEFYCSAHVSMSSEEYLFLYNQYDNDESKRGVMKINKKTGIYELFK